MRVTLASLVVGTTLVSCGPGTSNTVRVLVEAEDTITDGIPARAGGAGEGEGFDDGWQLAYERFYVSIGQVTLSDAQGAEVAVPASAAVGSRVFNLRAAATTEFFAVAGVPARRYDRVGYRSAPADANTTFADNVPAADRPLMLGYSTWITATATRTAGGVTRQVRLDWRFREGFAYSACEGPTDRPGAGFVVAEGGTTTLRLTIHGDHWYWQTLGQEGSPVRFDPIANADTAVAPYRGNGDGEVTLEELDAVALVDVPEADGVFNPAGRPVTTLGAYMRTTTGTNGHIDGDGVCVSRPAQ